MRLDNGNVNSDMLREVQLQILVEEVSLMVDGSEVIMQDGHWLGYLEEGQGVDKFDKVFWDKVNNDKCRMAVASKMKLSTTDGVELYNQDHMVQLRKKDRAYDTNCHLTYYHTDMTGVYLVEGTSKVRLPTLDGESISLNAQVNIISAGYFCLLL